MYICVCAWYINDIYIYIYIFAHKQRKKKYIYIYMILFACIWVALYRIISKHRLLSTLRSRLPPSMKSPAGPPWRMPCWRPSIIPRMKTCSLDQWLDFSWENRSRKPSIFPWFLWDFPVIFPVKTNQLKESSETLGHVDFLPTLGPFEVYALRRAPDLTCWSSVPQMRWIPLVRT